jgi:Cdc6-like AAA superfamily ATPase
VLFRSLARARADAELQLGAARGDYEMAERAFRAGEQIVPIGRGEAMRKTELYEQVRELLPSAERHLTDAIASVEKVRHLERGGGRMNEWYERLKGSRETALTVTGMQATVALREQLREVGSVLAGLERELGPSPR